MGARLMKRTRAQMLWTFQLYLDALKIWEPERRERLSAMFLERMLSRPTERDFLTWLKTNKLTPAPVLVRTRGSRLMFFSTWLNAYRPLADKAERERLIRLYNSKSLARDIERDFHRYMREEILK
jgi:hypothetical protein